MMKFTHEDYLNEDWFQGDESYSWQEGWHAGHWEHYLENSNIKEAE